MTTASSHKRSQNITVATTTTTDTESYEQTGSLAISAMRQLWLDLLDLLVIGWTG